MSHLTANSQALSPIWIKFKASSPITKSSIKESRKLHSISKSYSLASPLLSSTIKTDTTSLIATTSTHCHMSMSQALIMSWSHKLTVWLFCQNTVLIGTESSKVASFRNVYSNPLHIRITHMIATIKMKRNTFMEVKIGWPSIKFNKFWCDCLRKRQRKLLILGRIQFISTFCQNTWISWSWERAKRPTKSLSS